MDEPISGFDWDEGNLEHCRKHGVSRSEIEHVLSHKPMVRPDRTDSSESRFNAIGTNGEGRYLFIAFALRDIEGQTMIRPISARYMHQREIEHYGQR